MTEVGCYADKESSPDFEKLLSSSGELLNPKECALKVFEKGYQYVGLSDGGKCWGANKKIGKYGASS